MNAAVLDGNALATRVKEQLKARVAAITTARGQAPSLMVVSSDRADASAASYRASRLKACGEVGVRAQEFAQRWPSAAAVLDEVNRHDFDGVLLDVPLPGVDLDDVLAGLPADRDAEGATPVSFGRLFQAKAYADIAREGLIAPCTALAIAELLRFSGAPLAGKTAVVLGRSNIVGKPAAHLLTCLDLTATLCHSKTPGLAKIVQQADVVVAAIGKAHFVKADWIKAGAVVIDAGINAKNGKLLGDVEPQAVERAAFMTPVPGGVGPMTTAMLLANVVTLAERRLGRKI